ncbi:EAL domain-containing protein [Pelobacter propionicus]|uniref:Diguanylate cyclase/phosphodiesterase n=1 Tax=Pelobacter propionicus (strain DSM 2379 / NBRC 103807 / OttBd1) TaxID=338966 RepID=A1ASF8_PELPD|nr:EAL domain-containing protein [Pelobacter propionicus]ABL00279.1 diguanylate cyclase/phosphodiesterase [Pelobacter propionicus DSM 2379]
MTAKHFRAFRLPPLSRPSPLTIVLFYALTGMLWIGISEMITEALAGEIHTFPRPGLLKGTLFILLTSILLHLLIRFFVRELRTTGNILQAAFQASPDAINIKRLKDGVFLKINSGFTRTFGYSEAETIGRTASALELWESSADRLRLDSCLEQSRDVRDFHALFRTREGKLFRGSLTARRVNLEGDECLVTIVRDRTAELEAREEAEKLANYDPETGLPNHSLFMDRLERTIGQDARDRNKTVIIYISLTGYKAIVDVFGHDGESRIIKPLSRQIVAAVRQHDSVARIRHDEFAVMLGGVTNDGDVTTILNRLQQIFAVPLPTSQGECAIPACMGVACFPTDGLTANIIMQNAHIAMNQARQAGIPLQFYSESMNRKAMERFAIETCMLRAIDAGEFFLCYQPKVEIHDMKLTGVEALVRWQRPGEGVIPPDRFIALAEENGMIVRLGGWILGEACRQNRAWQDAGLPRTVVSVNISARQLRENSFVEQVERILEETGLEPCYLDLELTESVVMANSDEIVQKLTRLKQLGVGISVDDFGTGYSSLSYLKHLPVDTIKVDRSFVRDIVHDPDDKAIVEAVIAMGHALGLTVIAEGVETLEQLEFLRSQNCNQAQGYYFSKPLDSGHLARFLSKHCQEMSFPPAKALPLSPTAPLISAPLCLAAPPLTPPAEALTAGEPHCIGDVSLPIPPAHPSDNLAIVLKRFQTEKGLLVLPVVDAGNIIGILNRSIFLEEHVIGMHGFAFQINHSRKMRDLMAPVPLILEASTPIEEAAQTIQGLGEGVRIDNVCVARDACYQGIIDVNRFISAITEINLSLAKGANPLTGMPGNESIQREINNRLASGHPFDIAYIDVDNFKPYNDYYGFQRGDTVIKVLGEIITTATDTTGFCGHIGGDDFIVITEPHQSPGVASRIIRSFEGYHPLLHGSDDCSTGYYVSTNRKGERETFPLLSLSIGIVNTLQTPVSSYGQLASLSTEVKRLAKRQPGSSVVINRRLRADTEEGGTIAPGFSHETSQHIFPIATPS